MDTQHRTSVELRLIDRMSRGLRSIGGNVDRLSRGLNRLGGRMRSALGRAATAGVRGLRLSLRGLHRVASLAIGTLKRLTAISLGLASAAAYLGARYTQSAVQLTAGREAQEKGLRNLLGSAQRASAALKRLKQLAALPSLDFSQAIQGFSQLKSVGMQTKLAFDLIKESANAVAMGGGGPNELSLVLRGWTQMMGKGKVAAEELTQQILEQAPMIRTAIKRAFGTTEAEKLARIPLPQFMRRLVAEMKRLPRAGDGTKNAIENVGIAWDELKIRFGRGLLGRTAAAHFKSVADWLDRLGPGAERMGRRLRAALDVVIGKGQQFAAAWRALGRGDMIALRRLDPGMVDLARRVRRGLDVLRGIVGAAARGDWREAWRQVVAVVEPVVDRLWTGLKARARAGFAALVGAVRARAPGLVAAVRHIISAVRGMWQQLTTPGETGASPLQRFAQSVRELVRTVIGSLPRVIPIIGNVFGALARVPWGTIAEAIGGVITKLATFAAQHPDLTAGLVMVASAFATFGTTIATTVIGIASVIQSGLAAPIAVVVGSIVALVKWIKIALQWLAQLRATLDRRRTERTTRGRLREGEREGTFAPGAAAASARGEGVAGYQVGYIRGVLTESQTTAAEKIGILRNLGFRHASDVAARFPELAGMIPAFARGGIVTRPTIGLLGERGPEAVIPLRGQQAARHTFTVRVELGADVARRLDALGRERFEREYAAATRRVLEQAYAGAGGRGGG